MYIYHYQSISYVLLLLSFILVQDNATGLENNLRNTDTFSKFQKVFFSFS